MAQPRVPRTLRAGRWQARQIVGNGREMSLHVNEEGVPLRGDGTPFPEDPGQWSEEERAYLRAYQFGVSKDVQFGQSQVAMADVPELSADEGETRTA